jgi:low affinity Fe/Cu permease
MAGAIIVLTITSFLMFLYRHSDTTVAIHTTIGFVFLMFIIIHILSNFSSLKNYSINNKSLIRLSTTFLITTAIILLSVLGIFYEIPPFTKVYELGQYYRSQQNVEYETKKINYEIFNTNENLNGRKITIEVTKGKKDYYSVMAIWIEDTSGNYIETLYATKNIASGIFWQEINGKAVRVPVRRPEAIPYWSHKRNIIETDGEYIPTPETELIDGITGATPKSHFILESKLSNSKTDKFKILFEVNRSYDWNEFYNKNAFPDDEIYSGSGSVGQPSLIYSTPIINLNNITRKSYLMEVIGHGHHSGANGELYTDLSNITTALSITERVLVIVNE